MGSEYTKAVGAAAAALAKGEDANWELARLTYENTMSGNGKGQPGLVPMEQWCTDVREASGRKFSTDTGKLYRRIWREFGSEAPTILRSWTEAYYEVTGDSRDKIRERHTNVLTAQPDVKLETFRKLARDPIIREKLAHDPDEAEEVVDMVARSPKLSARAMSRAEEVRPAPAPQRPEPGTPASTLSYIASLGIGSKAKYNARSAADDVSTLVNYIRNNDLSDNGAAAVRDDVDALREAAEMYRRYAAEIELALGGEVAVDGWLRTVLNGEPS